MRGVLTAVSRHLSAAARTVGGRGALVVER
jgi:hypothetical protein